MNTKGRPPAWAIDLIEKALADEGLPPISELSWSRRGARTHFRARYVRDGAERVVTARERRLLDGLPELVPGSVERVVIQGSDRSSSGRAWGTWRIHVTAGTDTVDQRFVVAHEIAHIVRHHEGGHGHDAGFYRILARILRRYPNRTATLAYAAKRDGKHLARAIRETR